MDLFRPSLWRIPALAVLLLLPAVMLVNALLMWRELDQARDAYLRNTAARLAARLEQLPLPQLLDEEPALRHVQTYESPLSAPPAARRLLSGEALFEVDQAQGFRAWVPFHLQGRLLVAQLDLDPTAADFLTSRPTRNLYLTVAVSLTLAALLLFVLRLERQRARLERLAELGQLSAVLAHEIRNPLGALKGFLQLAQEQAQGPVRSYLDDGVEQATRLERLVQNLLLYARVPTPQPAPLRWEALAARLRPHAPGVVFSGPGFEWQTDAALLERLLLNLIRNALEAAHSQVTVDAAPGRIRVLDDGPGLDPAIRDRLFQPFVTTRAQGTGLGLAIARNLAQALGATLELRDHAPRGACAELKWSSWP